MARKRLQAPSVKIGHASSSAGPSDPSSSNGSPSIEAPPTPRSMGIHAAVSSNNMELAMELLVRSEYKDVLAKNEAGQTLLQLAAKVGSSSMTAFLLSLGADPSDHNRLGVTPLGTAASKSFELNPALSDFDSALGMAIAVDQVSVARLLLSHPDTHRSESTDSEGALGATALQTCVRSGAIRLVRTALILGLQGEGERAVRNIGLCLADSVPLNKIIRDELNTAMEFANGSMTLNTSVTLHEAVTSGNGWLVRRLLNMVDSDTGAAATYINEQEAGTGYSALHCAVRASNPNMVGLLLLRGANPTLKARDGSTPLLLAVRNSQYELVLMLLSHPSSHCALWNNFTTPPPSPHDMPPFLCALFNTPTGDQVTAFPESLYDDYRNISGKAMAEKVREAVTRGALNEPGTLVIQDVNGDTPLHVAIRTNQVPIVNALLFFSRYNHSYALEVKNFDGVSPVDEQMTAEMRTVIDAHLKRREQKAPSVEIPPSLMLPPCAICYLSPPTRRNIAHTCEDCKKVYCDNCLPHLALSSCSMMEIAKCQCKGPHSELPIKVLARYVSVPVLLQLRAIVKNKSVTCDRIFQSQCLACHRINNIEVFSTNSPTPRLECQHCGLHYCVVCNNVYCRDEDDAEIHAACGVNFINMRAFKEFSTMLDVKGQRMCSRCPNQEIGIKDTSCSHMTCARCSGRWCWVCGRGTWELGTDDIYSHATSGTEWMDNPRQCPMYISRLQAKEARIVPIHCKTCSPGLNEGCNNCRIVKDSFAGALIATIRVRYNIIEFMRRMGKKPFVAMLRVFHFENVINGNYFNGTMDWESDTIPHYLDYEPEEMRAFYTARESWFTDILPPR